MYSTAHAAALEGWVRLMGWYFQLNAHVFHIEEVRYPHRGTALPDQGGEEIVVCLHIPP